MNSRAVIPLIVLAIAAWFLISQFQQGNLNLPGLQPPQPLLTPTPPITPDPSPPAAITTPPPPSASSGTSDPDVLAAVATEAQQVFVLARAGQYSEAIATADAWLAKRPTDAVVALERQNALATLVKKPTLEIGLSAPLTGPLKQVGEAFAQGVNMAVAEANSAGGIGGKRIVVRVLNDGGNRAQAIEVASRMFASEALGVVGPYSSSTTLAAADVYNQGLAIVAPAATNPKISGAGPYIYRVAPSDLQQGAGLARLVKSRGHQAVAVLYDPDDAYSKGLAEAFQAEAERIGLTFSEIKFKLNGYDTAQVGNYAVDAIFVSGYTPDVAAVAKLEVLQKHEIFAGDGAYGQDLLAQGADKVEGVIVTSFWHATLEDATSQAFTKRFRARYGGGTPNANAMQAFDATRTLLEAIRRAPEQTREGVKAGLETFREKPSAGITSPIKFNVDGDVVGRPYVAIQVQNGKFQAIGFAK